MRRGAFTLATAALVVPMTLAGQGAAGAGPERIKLPVIGVNAPIKKVPVKDGGLAIGKDPRKVYVWKHGDPPCDSSGSSVYAGHAWSKGDGVADEWRDLRSGDIIKLPGCKFEVEKVEQWSKAKTKKKMKRLYRVDGPPLAYLVGCLPGNYSKRVIVTARLID